MRYVVQVRDTSASYKTWVTGSLEHHDLPYMRLMAQQYALLMTEQTGNEHESRVILLVEDDTEGSTADVPVATAGNPA